MTRYLIPIAVLLAAVALWLVAFRSGEKSLVVYCAHDAVFAQPILDQFQQRTGIAVQVRYDTEATKSLGLTERLASAAGKECDVFWNNEQLGTMDLARKDLLAAYQGPGWQRIPPAFRDEQGRWTGFAARMRVEIQGTSTAAQLAALAHDLKQGVIAKPLFGTTLTHYCALWTIFGGDAVKAWHAQTRAAGLREVDGNSMVRRLVADGTNAWGFTDTDDYFEAVDGGKAVTMVPAEAEIPTSRSSEDMARRLAELHIGGGVGVMPKMENTVPENYQGPVVVVGQNIFPVEEPQAGLSTLAYPVIVIPNTVAVLKDAPHADLARQLADYLLSAEVELALAKSSSRQIPLGPVDEAQMPEQVRQLRPYLAQAIPMVGLLEARDQVLPWLKAEYGK